MGRPPILTMELVAEAERLIGVLLHKEPVAALLGISRATFFSWLKRGAKEKRRLAKKGETVNEQEEIYVAFLDGVKRGLSGGELRDSLTILEASQRYWQAAAWRLERAFPQRWGAAKLDMKKLEKAVTALEQLGGQNPTSEAAD